jgi:hypothetical protein
MAGRYGLRLRNIYGDDERTPGEYVQEGVSGAIDELLRAKQAKEAKAEADRQERNEYTASGFTPVPRGTEMLSGPPRMARPGIGQALGQLTQPAPGEGMESVTTRSGEMFRRPGVEMRERAASQRRVTEKLATDPPLTFEQRRTLQTERPRSAMTQGDRLELERVRGERQERIARLTSQSRAASAAATSGRGNTSVQLNALQNLQTSYDSEVRSLRSEIAEAQKAYDDERVTQLRADLVEAQRAAEENRAMLTRLTGKGRTPASRPPRSTPAPRTAPPRP